MEQREIFTAKSPSIAEEYIKPALVALQQEVERHGHKYTGYTTDAEVRADGKTYYKMIAIYE